MQFKHITCVYVVSVLTGLSLPVQADYRCVCSVDGALPVFKQADVFHEIVGFLFENFCKQYLYPVDASWNAVVFLHQVGFVLTNVSILQTCRLSPTDTFTTTFPPVYSTTTTTVLTTDVETMSTNGSPPSSQTTLTIASTANMVTPETPSHSEFRTSSKYQLTSAPSTLNIYFTPSVTTKTTEDIIAPTTTKTQTASTNMTTPLATTLGPTTSITSTANSASATSPITQYYTTTQLQPTHVYEGHIELCPEQVKADVNLYGGFLGQYGEYCLELVNVQTQWHNAQKHCLVAGHGRLVEIQDLWMQDYVVRFLNTHAHVPSIWLGLTDSEQEGATAEGQWTWSSDARVLFTNFGADYSGHSNAAHKLKDCVIMMQGGEWTDVQCGVALALGQGFGERHSFICQYNVTSNHLNILHELGTALVD